MLSLERRPTGQLAVIVADTGPGIPPEERDRIFRPFWSKNGQGTGLGLAIARELAQALGGRLELDSEVGRGSTFVLVVPATLGPRPSTPGGRPGAGRLGPGKSGTAALLEPQHRAGARGPVVERTLESVE